MWQIIRRSMNALFIGAAATTGVICAVQGCGVSGGSAASVGGASSGSVGGQGGQGGTIDPCVKSSVRIKVFDPDGMPITKSTVTYGGAQLTPDDGGAVLLDNVSASHVVAQVAAPGYAPVSVVEDLPACANVTAVVHLIPLGVPQALDTSVDSEVVLGNVRVAIPAGSVVDENGNSVAGTIGVTIATIDPIQGVTGMPGPLVGTTVNQETVPLSSVLMAEVTLWQGDTKLELAPGASATVEFVIPDALQGTVATGDKVSVWSFAHDKGVWVEEGVPGTVGPSTVQPGKLALLFDTTHFTWFNMDYNVHPDLFGCIEVKVINAVGNQPIEGASVTAVGTNYDPGYLGVPGGTAVTQQITGVTGTGAANAACVDVLRGATSRIAVETSGYVVSGYTLAPKAGYLPMGSEFPKIVCDMPQSASCQDDIDCASLTVSMLPLTCLSGIVQDLQMNPIGGAKVHAVYQSGSSDKVSATATSAPNGKFCLSVPLNSSVVVGADMEMVNMPGQYLTSLNKTVMPTMMAKMCEQNQSMSGCNWAGTLTLHPASGNVNWAKSFGMDGLQTVTGVASDASGDIFVTGYFTGSIQIGSKTYKSPSISDYDAYLFKLQPDGSVAWSAQIGGGGMAMGDGDQQTTALAVDSLGNVVVVGTFKNQITIANATWPSTGASDGFVAKFAGDGTYQWSSSIGGPGEQIPEAVAIDSSPVDPVFKDNIAVTGYFNGPLGAVCGSCETGFNGCMNPCASPAGDDIFLLKFYKGGSPLLGKVTVLPGNQRARGIAVDKMGNLYLTGEYESGMNLDLFVSKVDKSGNPSWDTWGRVFGSGDGYDQRGVAIAVSADDSAVVVAGNYNTSITIDNLPPLHSWSDDVLIAKFKTADCTPLWATHSGTDDNVQEVSDVAFEANGDVILVGSSDATVQFEQQRPPIGLMDVYFAKLDGKTGVPRWSRRYGGASAYIQGPKLTITSDGIAVGATFGASTVTLGAATLSPYDTTYSDAAVIKFFQ